MPVVACQRNCQTGTCHGLMARLSCRFPATHMNTNKPSFLLSLAITTVSLVPPGSFAAGIRDAQSGPVHPTATADATVMAAEEAKPAPGKEPVIKEGAEVVLDGKLQDGMMGIGGESTGWLLKYAAKSGQNSIEVDCSALDVGKIPKGAVRVTGKVIMKKYVERGPTLILKAAKVEKRS